MEITRTQIIALAVIGLLGCLVAAIFISKTDSGDEKEDGILTTEPNTEQYGKEDESKPNAATTERGNLRGGQPATATQPNYGEQTVIEGEERSRGSIPDMSSIGDEEFDRIEQEIQEENRRYAQRQQAQDDSITRQNIDRAQQQLVDNARKKGDIEQSKEKKEKGKGKQNQETVKAQESNDRFSKVAVRKSAKTNAIKAYVHSQQVVRQGSTLKMRVAEDCLTDDGQLLTRNSFVYGTIKKIDGERVDVVISNVNVGGNILPFRKIVYSSDAQRGIRVTNTAKSEAAKEATSDAVEETNISTTTGGGLIGAGMGIIQGAVQGTKRAVSKNVKDVKVTIKTNYELLFMEPEEDDIDSHSYD